MLVDPMALPFTAQELRILAASRKRRAGFPEGDCRGSGMAELSIDPGEPKGTIITP